MLLQTVPARGVPAEWDKVTNRYPPCAPLEAKMLRFSVVAFDNVAFVTVLPQMSIHIANRIS